VFNEGWSALQEAECIIHLLLTIVVSIRQYRFNNQLRTNIDFPHDKRGRLPTYLFIHGRSAAMNKQSKRGEGKNSSGKKSRHPRGKCRLEHAEEDPEIVPVL
jgi:hypothetical protein